jgi:cation diffusion facilitator CzcD-associated flavoprotein CzcO
MQKPSLWKVHISLKESVFEVQTSQKIATGRWTANFVVIAIGQIAYLKKGAAFNTPQFAKTLLHAGI